MWYESPVYFFVVLAAYIVGSYLDIHSSIQSAWYYGTYEANRFMADKDGEFDVKKSLIARAIIVGISILAGVLSHSWGAGCALLVAGAVWFPIQDVLNHQKAHKGRLNQLAAIHALREGSVPDPTFETMNGKTFLPLFHWLYVPFDGDYTTSSQAALAKVQAFAQSGAAFPG